MDENNRAALKEWASVEQALATGRTTLLLRKGGIWERRGGFTIEHREFWIFPTRYHENPDELRSEFHGLIESARAVHPGPDHVRIGVYAIVEAALRIENIALLNRIAEFHPLTPRTVQSRFAYRNKPYLHALLLRCHRLLQPYVIPNTLDYEGCVSWVELDESLPTRGAVPVLLDREYGVLRDRILGVLDAEGAVRL